MRFALAIGAMHGPAPRSDHVADIGQLIRVARVIAVDRGGATCTLEVADPDNGGFETVPVQWGVIRAGATIVWSPPTAGEQVVLFCPDGDIAQAVPLGALFCDAFPAPGNGQREFVRFGDGAEIGYDPAAHHFDITLPAAATAHIEATGGVSIHGDVSIDGKLDVTGDIHTEEDLQVDGNAKIDGSVTVDGSVTADGDVAGGGISLDGHTHGGVTAGSDPTGPPE